MIIYYLVKVKVFGLDVRAKINSLAKSLLVGFNIPKGRVHKIIIFSSKFFFSGVQFSYLGM